MAALRHTDPAGGPRDGLVGELAVPLARRHDVRPSSSWLSASRRCALLTFIDGVRGMLERLLASNPEIRSVIPGVIRPVRDARGKIQVRVTVPTQNGWKAIALSAGARQELFISTELGKEELERAFEKAGATGLRGGQGVGWGLSSCWNDGQ